MSDLIIPRKYIPLVVSAGGFLVFGLCVAGCFVLWRRVEFRSNFTRREWQRRKEALKAAMQRKKLETGDSGAPKFEDDPEDNAPKVLDHAAAAAEAAAKKRAAIVRVRG